MVQKITTLMTWIREPAELLEDEPPNNAEAEELEENDDNNSKSTHKMMIIRQKNAEIDEIEENEGNDVEDNNKDANPVGVNDDNNENDGMEGYKDFLFDYEVAQTTQTTRLGSITRAPEHLNFVQDHIFTQGHKETSCSLVTA
jgi:hypothetical protein